MKKRSPALITFIVLSVVSIVAFLVLTAVMMALNEDGGTFGNQLEYLGYCMGGALTYPFNESLDPSVAFGTTQVIQFASNYYLSYLVLSILGYVICGLFFIAIVLGGVLFVFKEKPKYLGFLPAILVSAGIGLALVSYGNILYGTFIAFVIKLEGLTIDVGAAIFSILILVFGLFSLIFSIVTYIMLVVRAVKKPEIEEDSVLIDDGTYTSSTQPAIAEDSLNPEAVQEGEEITAPIEEEPVAEAYIPVLEPEPEPDPVEVPAPVVVEAPAEEAPAEEAPAPAPEPDENNNHLEVNVNNAPAPQNQIDTNSLASLLREVVRDIVRDEIARNNVNQPKPEENRNGGGNQTITGATFGGPLVVQYFNGGINGVNPAAAPAPVPAMEPAPAPEKPAEPAPVPAMEPAPAPAPEEAPVVEAIAPAAPLPVEEKPAEEKPVYERLTFAERLLKSDKEVQDLYNEIKNEILSYGVKSRISANGDTFRLHKKMYVRITVAGKSLKLYFALNPDDYKDSKMPIQDAGHKGMYAEIPLVFKVKSGLSVRRCKELIQDCMDKDGLEQGEVGKINWIKELKAEMKAGKSSKED